jgi:hypothetical protein
MHSAMTAHVRQIGCASKTFKGMRPGGAIAAGAVIGLVAATVAGSAGAPPAPGYCRYCTDPSKTQGFRDVRP